MEYPTGRRRRLSGDATVDDMSEQYVRDDEGRPVPSIPRKRCRLAYVSDESTAPSNYKWPEWWFRPGKTSRIYLTGDTGSGKTTLVNTLISSGLKGPPIPFDTCYIVTDKPKWLANMRFAQSVLDNKYLKTVSCHKKRRNMFYDAKNPNFKLAIMNGREFKDVNLDQLNTRPLGPRGPFNHTLIIIDDVNLGDRRRAGKHSTLGFILSQGREFGISLIYVTQGIVTDEEDGVTIDQRGQFDTLMVTGKIRRIGYNRDMQISRYTGGDMDTAREIGRELANFDIGDMIVYNDRCQCQRYETFKPERSLRNC